METMKLLLGIDELLLGILDAAAASLGWFGDSVVRTWWFEPAQVTLCFAIFINWYWYHERAIRVSSDVTFRSTVDWTTAGPLFQSGIAYWVGIYLWTSIVPPAATHIPDGVPANATHFLYLSAEVVTGIVLYDAIFFVIHWAMHEIPCLRYWHARHHEQQKMKNHHAATATTTTAAPVESRDTLRHSLVDGSLQVLVNILVQRHAPWGAVKTRLARVLHNVLVIWMLTEAHSAAPTPCIWRSMFAGVRDHYQHHTTTARHVAAVDPGRKSGQAGAAAATAAAGEAMSSPRLLRYQQFFGYLDDLRFAFAGQHHWRR